MRAELFHPDRGEISLNKVLHALSDPIRRDIARTLYEGGPMVCGRLSYPIAKSTLSHHLKVLRESGLMATEVRGTSRVISLRRTDIDLRFPGLLDAVQVTAPAPEGVPGAAQAADVPGPRREMVSARG
ncbi:ArsR/SmtB family transcription factor [Streptomyces albireticuli]|uniref:Transcriptional regulator n=1 Tax=Streptomyces albireticuli TaxID=1940 RepID=A0A2A2CZK2_9ACTN|nr:helix-turn-helix transcriptional regulator [Streptomyces albireticuli]MCD9140700.1 helix-turn-helix domain-containing protein [Streptomyces albireticuli]MCD9161338.1 helix-turn-helix domain-containing protein [Streptomyces albireticuli]MCD9190604.1 helix-turn-helix domain-containing protein [Streptomyces albireticuli]PAU44589.1 transcriptional regulator [Streptomyces albireticuli]